MAVSQQNRLRFRAILIARDVKWLLGGMPERFAKRAARRWLMGPLLRWLFLAPDGRPHRAGEIVLAELRDRFSTLVIYGDADDAVRLPAEALVAEMTADTELRPATLTLSTVPPAWWAAAALMLAYGLWNLGTNWWAEREAARRAAAEQAAELDPVAAWHEALNRWAEGLLVLAPAGLPAILDAIVHTPVDPGRWRLAEIDCRPAAGACTARYRRSRLADNATLLAALPAEWSVRWIDLDTAEAQWRLEVPRQPVQLAALATTTQLETIWMPAAQGLRPALTGIDVRSAAETVIPAPMVRDRNGAATPLPFPNQAMARPRERALVVNGPLRSLYGLDLPVNTVVEQVQVRHQEAAQSGLAASPLMSTLRGTIYVR